MLNGTILTKRNSVELWLRTKDEKYFNQVYAQFQKGLFRHVQKIVKEEDVAHDIVSDTFCSVLQNVSQYNPSRGAFTTWVYNIAKNAAYAWINHERKQEYIRKESFTVLYSVRGIFAIDGFEDQELKEEFLQTEDNENIDGEILLGKVHQRVIYYRTSSDQIRKNSRDRSRVPLHHNSWNHERLMMI